ncbi:hypothetical protein [Paucibacter sp. B51]|uniref:hypothetical protein n=1 Tax=Paucibacter sp. B51 TaxID=2993315 RepID=UPI0022EBAA0A|nr:hypothetical protein [Paucibacter sp. B51]
MNTEAHARHKRLWIWGGGAALFEALSYIVGFAAITTWLKPEQAEGWDAARRLAFVLERQAAFQAVNLLVYVAFGLALVLLSSALHERFRASGNEALMRVASPFGYIWAGLVIASGMLSSVGLTAVATLHAKDPALAMTVWQMLTILQDGLGGGVEVVGGAWVLLLAIAGLRESRASALAWLGVLCGSCGVLTLLPPLRDLGAVFGITQIVWFTGVGLMLLRAGRRTSVG